MSGGPMSGGATLVALRAEHARLRRWGRLLAARLGAGARLLAAGNGGSAAEAQHLTAELVGRFTADRPPFSAIALHADSSTVTAVANDYGHPSVFARQVTAHARPADVVVLLSVSGHSANAVSAAIAGRDAGAVVPALTGPAPNPLAAAADDALCLPGGASSVQEAHLVAVHLPCTAFEVALREQAAPGRGRALPVRPGPLRAARGRGVPDHDAATGPAARARRRTVAT